VKREAVTVVGLGPMGRAMADAFLDQGRRVTVWNRTAGKADDLVAAGAHRPADLRDALVASDLVLVSLRDQDAVTALLAPEVAALRDRVLVNLSSGTPDEARATAAWAAEHGVAYLQGGPRVPPSGIGLPESVTFYSGPKDVFESCRDDLAVLTGADYRGTDPGLAMVYYQLEEALLWMTMTGYLHAVAVAQANGISAGDLLPYATRTLASGGELLAFYAPRIDAGDHEGEFDSVGSAAAGIDHVVRTSRDAGVDAHVPEAVLQLFHRGAANGRANDSSTSLIDVLRTG